MVRADKHGFMLRCLLPPRGGKGDTLGRLQHQKVAVLLALLRWICGLFCLVLMHAPAIAWEHQAGVVDLRHWNPETTPVLSLTGEWNVAWERLAGAESSQPAAENWPPTPFPELWNNAATAPAGMRDGSGAATYRLRVLLPADRPEVSLRLPQMKSAMRAWIDGRLVAQSGEPSLDGKTEIPQTATRLVAVPSGVREFVLAVDISNHFHFEGGPDTEVRIGATTRMERDWLLHLLVNAGVVLSLFVLAVYVAAFGRRATSTSWSLVLLLAVTSLRMSSTSELLTTVFPHAPAGLSYRVEYLAIYLFWPICFHLLHDLFPGYMHRRVGWAMSALGLAGCALVLLTPPAIFTASRDVASSLLAASTLYFAWRLWVAWRGRQPYAGFLGLGVMAFTASVVHDGLMYAHAFESIDLAPFGLLLLIVAQSIALGRRVLTALTDVERLSVQLGDLNRDLERQVEERTAEIVSAHAELRRAKEDAEREAAMKSRFLADLSHEVRTPLNALVGMTWLLQQGQGDPDGEDTRKLRLMQRIGAYLARLVEDVLDLSPDGAVVVVPEPVELPELMESVRDMLLPLAEERSLRLRVDCPYGDRLLLDPFRARQILVNLAGSAIRYSAKGSVSMAAKLDSGRLVFSVADRGPDIPSHLWGPVDEGFATLDSALGRGGFGLRLGIVLRIARALNARLTVGGRPEGGAVFTIDMAAPPVSAVAPPPKLTNLPLPPPPRLRVLLVEDAPENQMVLEHYLADHDLVCVERGEDAVAQMSSRPFDLVLMDVRLAGAMNGVDATRAIRALENESAAMTPIIAMTANVSREDHALYCAAGMDEVIAKPIDRERLLDAVARHAPVQGSAHPADPIVHGQALDLFRNVCRTLTTEVEQAARTGDHERMSAIGHRLRGSAGLYGFGDLQQAAEDVEEVALRRGDLSAAVAKLLAQLRQVAREGQNAR